MKRGKFIVIEGIDGSGKGTQSKMLKKFLLKKGYDVHLTQEPTSTAIGRLLRKNLKNGDLDPVTEALLFAADRNQHTSKIKNKLDDGVTVICDRYILSSLAYQGAHGLDNEWIKTINNFALVPDLLIVLDLEPELALQRVNSRGGISDYFEKKEFLNKVRDIYLSEGDGIVLDARKPRNLIAEEIGNLVVRYLF